jgi:hypothetical protein
MRKEIHMGHGLYKQVEEEQEEADEVLTDQAFSGLPFSSYQTYSEQMQDELEPIIHPTQHDESDELEALKSEEMTEFEKSEYKRKIAGETKKRSVWGEEGEGEVEWRIVKLPGGGFIRRPFSVKKATLAGPDEPKRPWHFLKGEKWEHEYDT